MKTGAHITLHHALVNVDVKSRLPTPASKYKKRQRCSKVGQDFQRNTVRRGLIEVIAAWVMS